MIKDQRSPPTHRMAANISSSWPSSGSDMAALLHIRSPVPCATPADPPWHINDPPPANHSLYWRRAAAGGRRQTVGGGGKRDDSCDGSDGGRDSKSRVVKIIRQIYYFKSTARQWCSGNIIAFQAIALSSILGWRIHYFSFPRLCNRVILKYFFAPGVRQVCTSCAPAVCQVGVRQAWRRCVCCVRQAWRRWLSVFQLDVLKQAGKVAEWVLRYSSDH